MPFLCAFPFLICKNRCNIPCLAGIWTRFIIYWGLHPVVGMISTPEAMLILECSPTPSFYRWEAEAAGHRAGIRFNLWHWGQHLLKGMRLVLIYLLSVCVCVYLLLCMSTAKLQIEHSICIQLPLSSGKKKTHLFCFNMGLVIILALGWLLIFPFLFLYEVFF